MLLLVFLGCILIPPNFEKMEYRFRGPPEGAWARRDPGKRKPEGASRKRIVSFNNVVFLDSTGASLPLEDGK